MTLNLGPTQNIANVVGYVRWCSKWREHDVSGCHFQVSKMVISGDGDFSGREKLCYLPQELPSSSRTERQYSFKQWWWLNTFCLNSSFEDICNAMRFQCHKASNYLLCERLHVHNVVTDTEHKYFDNLVPLWESFIPAGCDLPDILNGKRGHELGMKYVNLFELGIDCVHFLFTLVWWKFGPITSTIIYMLYHI